MKLNKKTAINFFSNSGYIIGCVILYLIALCIIGTSVWNIIRDMMSHEYTVYKLLDEVGLIVFSIAVIDVAKYLMYEEVLRPKQERRPIIERRTLTKFAVIIATALALEGLVLTIEVAKTDITQLLYPVSVLITAMIFIIGIGIYQNLNANSEKQSK